MQLLIKQRVFSWGQKFDIYDVDKVPQFFCKSKIITLGHKLYVYDQSGKEVIYIKQRLFTFLPKYDIYINGEYRATIHKKFTILSNDFYFEGVDWVVEGDFLAYNYRILSNGVPIMSLTKKWVSWGDTYYLDLNDSFDPLLALASALAIDCACHSK